jgi:hypothetical protein
MTSNTTTIAPVRRRRFRTGEPVGGGTSLGGVSATESLGGALVGEPVGNSVRTESVAAEGASVSTGRLGIGCVCSLHCVPFHHRSNCESDGSTYQPGVGLTV